MEWFNDKIETSINSVHRGETLPKCGWAIKDGMICRQIIDDPGWWEWHWSPIKAASASLAALARDIDRVEDTLYAAHRVKIVVDDDLGVVVTGGYYKVAVPHRLAVRIESAGRKWAAELMELSRVAPWDVRADSARNRRWEMGRRANAMLWTYVHNMEALRDGLRRKAIEAVKAELA